MLELFVVSLMMVLGALLPLLIVRYDVKRLPPLQRSRAWNDVTMLAAPIAFGPLCLIVHFIKTRRSWVGAVLGLVWVAGVLAALGTLGLLVENVPSLE